MTTTELLDKIIQYPANENSDPDVMGCAINEIKDLAREIKSHKDVIVTLTISHEHGANVYPCASREIADAYLYDFVARWWEDEFGDEPIPTDKERAIEDYFCSDLCVESYNIDEEYLLTTFPKEGA